MLQAAQSVVFIDANVSNVQHLVNGVLPGVSVKVLTPDIDGIAQITDYLRAYPASTVHIVSHGAPGILHLGNTQLNLTNLENHAQALRSWFSPQASNPTLLLYGCNVAAGDAGEEFIETLHTLTGASIGASTTKVGNPNQGGSWNLDRQVADPTYTAVFNAAAVESYSGVFAVSVSGLNNFTYTEGSSPVVVDNSINFSSTVNYNDGSLRFDLTNGTSADQFALTSSATPNAVGAISVVGADVYLGNGSGRDRIGSIDAVLNGTNGQDLVINFASPLTNSGFETGNLTGWTAFNQNYSSVNNLNGQSIPYKFNALLGTDTGNGTIILGSNPNASYSVTVQSSVVSTGNFALQLVSNGSISGPSGSDRYTGNGSLHGPYVRSNTFQAFIGDSITLDYAAQNGQDAYEVFGFLVGAGGDSIFGTGDDTRSRLFAQRGDTQSFTEASAVISTTGAYQFEFVGGTYDKTGGLALGASLYIDNVRLVSATTVNDAVVAAIAQQITFQNTSNAPDTTTRNLQVTVINSNNESSSVSSSGTVIAVDQLPNLTFPTGAIALSDGTAAVIAANLGLVDADGPAIGGAKVSIGTGFKAGQDALGILGQAGNSGTVDGIVWGYNSSTGILTLTGNASAATYEAALRKVTFISLNDTAATAGARDVQFTIGNPPTNSGNVSVTVNNVNDAPTGSVTLTGAVQQGSVLTANTSTLADAEGLGTLSYQWQQSSDGSTWTTIAGATASTFTLTQAQVNQFVRSQVSFTDGGGTAESVLSNATATKVANVNDAPAGSVTINGTIAQGQVLTANTSNLSDPDGLGTLNYQWQQSTDGVTWTTIAGATASTFTPAQAQVNQFVRSQVSYTDGGGTAESVLSNATATKVTNVNDAPTGGVTLSGTVAQGQILTANTSTLADADGLGTLSYQWQQSSDGNTWTTISGATANTFTLTQAQVGQFVRSQVNFTDGGGTAESVLSNATAAKVANVNDAPTGGVALSGTAAQGQILTATSTLGDPDGLGTLNYQWQQSSDGITWTTITGATASTFALTQGQVNQFVRSQVSFTDGGGSLETVNSSATAAKVANVNDAPTGGVTLNGTGAQGQILTANTSNLSDPDGLGTLNYQWQQSSDGNTWTTIAGATASTFTLTQTQVNQFVRSQVNFTDGGGSLETVNSNATAAKVANVNDAPTGSVTIDGTVAQGKILTANTSTLFDADGLGTLSYQWKQSSDGITWSNIDGATGNTFSPRNAQVSQFLQVAVSYVDGQGTSESLTSAPTSGSVVKFNATSDFNGDGSVDIFWRHQNVGESVFWLMDNVAFSGDGDFLSPTIADVNWDIKAVGDLNGDGDPDLVWQNKATNQAAVWLMDGVNLTSGALLPNDAAAGWKVVESGDFNSNGKDDILWRNANTGQLAVWFMDGTDLISGEFITLNAGLDWEVGAVGDFTKDGKTDIFWENRITGANAFWEMDGTTFVNGYQTATAETIWQAQGAADFNQDGDLDLLWHNPGTGENALWLMDGMNLTAGVALPTTEVSWNPSV
ncbi:MAG: DUF4347 domain-containing protein [Tildeniella torsiva UHER 1998/13D]|jgi:hypothetical protein|nr:DUF4347 domain-containing protein [Tildeniella torsiva UHER 1998/13D]